MYHIYTYFLGIYVKKILLLLLWFLFYLLIIHHLFIYFLFMYYLCEGFMCRWSATRGFYATPAPVKWATNTMKKFLEGTLRSRLKAAWRQRLRNATQTQSVSWKKHLTSLVTNRLFSTKALASGVQWYFGFGIKKKAPASVSTLEDTTSYNTTLDTKARQPETWEEGPGRLRNGATQTATYIFLHGGFSHSRCLPQSFNPHFCRRLSSNCSARKCKSSFPTGSACHKFTQRCMKTPRNGEAALPQNHSGAFTLLAIGAPTSSAQRNWSARRA